VKITSITRECSGISLLLFLAAIVQVNSSRAANLNIFSTSMENSHLKEENYQSCIPNNILRCNTENISILEWRKKYGDVYIHQHNIWCYQDRFQSWKSLYSSTELVHCVVDVEMTTMFMQAHSFNMNCMLFTNSKYGWWKYLLAAYLRIILYYVDFQS
jgi:hypothetical protein